MSKKEKFIEMVEILIRNAENDDLKEYKEALEYFEMFKAIKETEKPKFTEIGKKVIQYMKDNREKYNNMFKAKEIGEGLFVSSRGAGGALRKLVTDGYAEKIGENPVVYALTDLGINVEITD